MALTVDVTSYGGYATFLFKDKYTEVAASIEPTWVGQSDYAPTSSAVYIVV